MATGVSKGNRARRPAPPLVGPDELRAQREDQRRADADPADHAHSLEQARAIYAKLADADELHDLPAAESGVCDDCHDETRWHSPKAADPETHAHAYHRYRIGRVTVCRRHALLRLNAQRQLNQPTTGHAVIPKPADLNAWISRNLRWLTRRSLNNLLDDWHADDDTRHDALDHLADASRAAAEHHERRQARQRRRNQARQETAA